MSLFGNVRASAYGAWDLTQGHRLKMLIISIFLGGIVAFFAMNWSGAMFLLQQFGGWTIAQFQNIIALAMAGLRRVYMSVIALGGNVLIAGINAMYTKINEILGSNIPLEGYLTSYTANVSLDEILVDMGMQNSTIFNAFGQYGSGLVQNPTNTVIGAGAGAATTLGGNYLLDDGGDGNNGSGGSGNSGSGGGGNKGSGGNGNSGNSGAADARKKLYGSIKAGTKTTPGNANQRARDQEWTQAQSKPKGIVATVKSWIWPENRERDRWSLKNPTETEKKILREEAEKQERWK